MTPLIRAIIGTASVALILIGTALGSIWFPKPTSVIVLIIVLTFIFSYTFHIFYTWID